MTDELMLATTPQGFKKLCEIILKKGVPPLVDPKGEKEPFWTIVMPEGHVPDMVKITLMEWENTMKQNPTMQDVRKAKEELNEAILLFAAGKITMKEREKARQKYDVLHRRWQDG